MSPTPPSTGTGTTQDITVRDRDKKFARATNESHRFRLLLNHAHILEVEDVHFHFDSAVMLPDHGPCHPDVDPADENHVSGLAAIRACYTHARNMPSNVILLAGHTDRSGSPDYNLNLSQLRADNVLHVLLGNRADWVAIARKKHKVEDYQQILIWIRAFFGWDTDPGPKNNVNNAKTQAAVRRFQKQYNATFHRSISVDGVVGEQTWGAFFDMYMEGLKRMMGVDDAGLADARARIRFLDSSRRAVGCGENHPITPDLVENQRSQIDRRVHILFFDPPELPELSCHPSPGACDPTVCQLYGPNRIFRFDPLPCDPASVGRRYRIRLELGDIDKLFPDIAANTHTDPGVRQRLQAAGFLYEPLNSPNINDRAKHAWNHFKEVIGVSDDAGAVGRLRRMLREIIVDQGTLPPENGFRKIRVPGTYGNSFPGTLFDHQNRVWTNNPSLGLIPIVAQVEQREGNTWSAAAAGLEVHFQLVEPADIAGSDVAPQPLRSAAIGGSSSVGFLTKPGPPPAIVAHKLTFTSSPDSYVTAEITRARPGDAPDDPQMQTDTHTHNAHRSVGGKRGNAVAGTNRMQNLLLIGQRAGFHDELKLNEATASPHPRAVRVVTNDEGKAAVIFMPSWTGGDRYRIRAFLDPIPEPGSDQASDGSEAFAVRADTGTLVVWRILRFSKYLRWEYPAGVKHDSSDPQFLAGGGELNDFDLAENGVICSEYKKAFLDPVVEPLAQGPHPLSQAQWQQAIRFARDRARSQLPASILNRVHLDTLIPDTTPNPTAAVVRFRTPREYDAVPPPGKTPSGAGWPSLAALVSNPTTRAQFWADMEQIFHAVSQSFLNFFTRDAISGLTIIQAPLVGSYTAAPPAQVPDMPVTPWRNSGFGGPNRGCYVIYGSDVYSSATFPYGANVNTLHETGHVLYRPHQYTNGTPTGRNQIADGNQHDWHDLCLMGYLPCRNDFCGYCVLNHAGWNTARFAVNGP